MILPLKCGFRRCHRPLLLGSYCSADITSAVPARAIATAEEALANRKASSSRLCLLRVKSSYCAGLGVVLGLCFAAVRGAPSVPQRT